MKKIFLIGMLVLSTLFLSGCGHYGNGESIGYITTIEDNMDLFVFPTRALWFRAELESSQTDCYRMNEDLESIARSFSESKTKVRIKYERHYIQFGCGNDKVYSIEAITSNP